MPIIVCLINLLKKLKFKIKDISINHIISGKMEYTFIKSKSNKKSSITNLKELSLSLNLKNLDTISKSIQIFDNYIKKKFNKDFDYYTNLLPYIIKWSNKEPPKMKLLESIEHGIQKNIFTREQIRIILANSWLNNTCTIYDYNKKEQRKYGSLDWSHLFNYNTKVSINRILCQLAYFYQQLNATKDEDNEMVQFIRYSSSKNIKIVSKKIDTTKINIFTTRMEDSDAPVFVDFANCDLHIHKIMASCTQEEILFSVCPEAFVGLLFCERMDDHEIIYMTNLKRYSDYKGYYNTFEFDGFYSQNNSKIDMIAMDATNGKNEQIYKKGIQRDIKKAYLGFHTAQILENDKIVTGSWGCGIFGGNKLVKFLQQILAASLLDLSLDYSCAKVDFASDKDTEYLIKLIELIKIIKMNQIKTDQIYNLLMNLDNIFESNIDIEKYIIDTLKHKYDKFLS